MKKRIPNQTFPRSTPNPPEVFSRAMRETLQGIVQAESAKGESTHEETANKAQDIDICHRRCAAGLRRRHRSRAADGNRVRLHIGVTPENAASMIQYDLADETIGDTEVKVTQAAYDGMSLFVAFSMRDLNAAEPFGIYDEASGMRFLTESDYEYIEGLGVGWWVDHIWIDGQPIDMPAMSSVMDVATDTPGEVLYSMLFRLDQEEVYLSGKSVEISMPIGERQSLDTLVKDAENGQIALPDKGDDPLSRWIVSSATRW